jgi:hypothetical protein
LTREAALIADGDQVGRTDLIEVDNVLHGCEAFRCDAVNKSFSGETNSTWWDAAQDGAQMLKWRFRILVADRIWRFERELSSKAMVKGSDGS